MKSACRLSSRSLLRITTTESHALIRELFAERAALATTGTFARCRPASSRMSRGARPRPPRPRCHPRNWRAAPPASTSTDARGRSRRLPRRSHNAVQPAPVSAAVSAPLALTRGAVPSPQFALSAPVSDFLLTSKPTRPSDTPELDPTRHPTRRSRVAAPRRTALIGHPTSVVTTARRWG